MYCPYCGNKLEEGAKFCSKCGKPIAVTPNAPDVKAAEPGPQNPETVRQAAPETRQTETGTRQPVRETGGQQAPEVQAGYKAPEKVRLTMGIISCILFIIIFIQSCAAGVVNSMNHSRDTGGSAGLFVGILAVAAGIIGIVNRKNGKGSVIAGAVYVLAGLIGTGNDKVYQDLSLWGTLFLIFGAYFIYTGRKQLKGK